MDPTGVVIGAASLLTLFKTCLEMYESIESGRNLGTDYEVLSTKVGIERVRLALWGDVVGLFDLDLARDSHAGPPQQRHGVDPRLGEPRIARAVSDILNCMRQLFEDSGSLTRRYGLQPTSSVDSTVAVAGIRGDTVATTFRNTYARLHASASRVQQSTSLVLTARWAIKDKKRFGRFIDDLRGFNDSLTLLFPDVDVRTRATMAAEINESTDLDGLQTVVKAVVDLEGGEEFAEVASMRITQLSEHNRSAPSTAASQSMEESAADINVHRLARQIEKLESSLSKRVELRGQLQFSLSAIRGGDCFAQYSWYGISRDEEPIGGYKEAEYIKNSYPAWSLMYTSDRKRHDQGDFTRLDIESNRLFEGKYPSTRTVEGYTAEFNAWMLINNPITEQYFNTIGNLPDHSLEFILGRLRRAQSEGDRFWSEHSAGNDLNELIGLTQRLSGPGGSARMQDQVTDLLNILNRRRVFPDVLEGVSLCKMALMTSSLDDFLLQVLLARELRMRMVRLHDTSFGNVSHRIVAAMHASERWLDGVRLTLPDAKHQPDQIDLHSLVHERQIEGLIRFAETIAWPALEEMRPFAEESYASIRAGGSTSPHLWDWLFGLMLPGKTFISTIMSALVAATPGLQKLGAPKYYISGLVVGDRSYWPAKSVLGRVLGGLKGVRGVNGWIGPCPAPVRLVEEGIADGWWRVKERIVAFNSFMSGHQPGDGSRFPPFHRGSDDTTAARARDVWDRSKWVVPFGPKASPDDVEFRAVRFEKIGETVPNTSPAVHQGHEKEEDEGNSEDEGETTEDLEQRVILELSINSVPATFSLYTKPVFLAAPRCGDGPHAATEQDLPKMQHILRVSQLLGYVHDDKRVLIIDATGRGECELAARAWCSEFGQNAILTRGQGTCFACAVKAASQGGLVIGCVIWTGP
ncbi:hypothetical protein VE03_08057 [Pseudogymnoascus sp. 23342-1-I1]|nr:hypothetical protein VE03_08057 [Pseudogymnoascus sp. 23342-1-I1]